MRTPYKPPTNLYEPTISSLSMDREHFGHTGHNDGFPMDDDTTAKNQPPH
jgi:hypothetical protein